jgi:hypothetical protein
MSRQGWTKLSNALRYVWATVFFGGAVAFFAFGQYANFERPHAPDSDKGWTVMIPWSYGAYGTTAERDLVLRWFNCQIYSFGIIAAGEAIRIYKLGENPSQKLKT